MMNKRIALMIELPSCYTDDLDEYRESLSDFADESEWLLSIMGEPNIVLLKTEVSGEKDSSIEEVWGLVREAHLVEASFYEVGKPVTAEELAERGWKLAPDEPL